MASSDILWQGWLLSTGKTQADWKKRYFLFTSKQLSYHDAPNTLPTGVIEYSKDTYICWLKEGVNYCKQQYLFSKGQGSGPILTAGEGTNIFVLFSNTATIQIGCEETKTVAFHDILRCKFRSCSVIAACDVFRKKNKFQWTKNFLVVLTSRDLILLENDSLDTIIAHLSPVDAFDNVQIIQGTEFNYKCLLEVKMGEKTLLLSTGSNTQSLQLCNEIYHVLFFVMKGCHPSLPSPPSIAWSLPLLTAYSSGLFVKGIFEREAINQGVQEEIRPWIWQNLCESLLKGNLILSVEDVKTLVIAVSSISDEIDMTIQQLTDDKAIQDGIQLLCRYVIATQISYS